MLKFESININKLNKLSGYISELLEPSDLLGFVGDLGAGKTTFIKSLAGHLNINEDEVVSPTFILLQRYDGKHVLYHWDLYRLSHEKELFSLDYEEYFFGKGICLVEWFDKLEKLKPSEYLLVNLETVSDTERNITFTGVGKRGKEIITGLENSISNLILNS